MLRSSSARLAACITSALWALPAYAQSGGVTGGAAREAALLIVVVCVAMLVVPRAPRARYVTRAVRVRGGK